MQERFLRPKFTNPFTPKNVPTRPMFMGFFRAAPLHRFGMGTITAILDLAAKRPEVFGLPDAKTCVVNTTYMLPSVRSRQHGITVFGTERGCRTVVIPASCSKHAFDVTDAKLMEPIFRWNPSVETLFLSKDCESIAPQLAALVRPLRLLKRVIMVDWEDPANINKVVMAARSCEEIDVMSPDEQFKNWNNEVAVESMCEMIEMHQKLRAIHGSVDYLSAVSNAVQFSRCKHNVAMVMEWCGWSRVFRATWTLGVAALWAAFGYAVWWAMQTAVPEYKLSREILSCALACMGAVAVIGLDHFRFRHTGRGWTYGVRWLVLARHRLLRHVA